MIVTLVMVLENKIEDRNILSLPHNTAEPLIGYEYIDNHEGGVKSLL